MYYFTALNFKCLYFSSYWSENKNKKIKTSEKSFIFQVIYQLRK